MNDFFFYFSQATDVSLPALMLQTQKVSLSNLLLTERCTIYDTVLMFNAIAESFKKLQSALMLNNLSCSFAKLFHLK